MPGIHDIKKQINSVKNTQQITKAMELVAASKLKRAQEKALGARPYSEGLKGLLSRFVESGISIQNPLLSPGKPGPICYVLVTADRGLCGGYNSNMLRFFSSVILETADEFGYRVLTVGKKGRDFCRRTNIDVDEEFSFADHVTYQDAALIAGKVVNLFQTGAVSEVRLMYTRFLSTVAHKPVMVKMLPITPEDTGSTVDEDGERIPTVEYLLEPSPQDLMASLLPKYVTTLVLGALLEAKASELGARMVAMGSATDNAEQLIETLSLKFNRERQAAITREISEIVGGAEALS